MRDKMKILHMYDGHERVFPGEGSVPSVVYQIAKHTAKKGLDVTVLERRWRGTNYREEIERIKFERIDLKICSEISNKEIVYTLAKKPSGLLRLVLDRAHFALKVNKYLSKNDFDIIHVHLPFASNVLINLKRKLRVKMIYTAHVGEEKVRFKLGSCKDAPLPLRFFSPDLYLMKRVKKSVVLNEPLRLKLIGKGIKAESIVTIPNGVDVSNFGSDVGENIRNKYRAEKRKTMIMFAGSITPRKGVDYLVKAAEMLKGEDIIFLLVGNPNLDKEFTEKIKEFIRTKGLEENVKLAGFVPYEDLKILYSVCDIFVLPSLEEGSPIALTEALATGKPLIGTSVGGTPLMIKDGWNGFLIEPANERQLAEKIKYLIDDPEERKRMSENSRKLAEEEFDWIKVTERYLEVYEEILDGNQEEIC